MKNNNPLKPRYTEPCNFLTKRAWVSQQCTLVVAKDSNVSHYLNSWAHLVMIISLSLINLLLLINKFSFICEGQSCRVCISQLSYWIGRMHNLCFSLWYWVIQFNDWFRFNSLDLGMSWSIQPCLKFKILAVLTKLWYPFFVKCQAYFFV